jgi:hypothetical protein
MKIERQLILIARGEIKNNIIRPEHGCCSGKGLWRRADELLVRSCFSLFGRAVEILISDDMSLPCDVNHPLWTDGSRWGDCWENSGNRKREKLGRWHAGETVLPTALRLISSRISSLSGRSDAEQIDAHHSAICFIGLVYISTFWKQFIGMMMSTKQLGKLLLLWRTVFDFR